MTKMCLVLSKLSERLAQARKRAGVTQVDLAAALDRDRSLISHIERGHAGKMAENLVALSRELDVSADYLLGLTENPTPAEKRAILPVDVDFVPFFPQKAVAGITGGTAFMLDASHYPFRSFRLKEEDVDPELAVVLRVQGDSMFPTLPDESAILVDTRRKALHPNRLYVFRINSELVVKRAQLKDRQWWFCSDNPDYEDLPGSATTEVWGEVRWCGRKFNDHGL